MPRYPAVVRKAVRAHQREVPSFKRNAQIVWPEKKFVHGKAHFDSIARTVKRALGFGAPVFFADNVVAFLKLAEQKQIFLEVKHERAASFSEHKYFFGQGGFVLADSGKLVVFLDKKSGYLWKGPRAAVKISTEKEATCLKGSVIAHEVAEGLVCAMRKKSGQLPSKPLREFFGVFFEFDYLYRKNPKLASLLFEECLKQAGRFPEDDYSKAIRLVKRFRSEIKDSQKRKQVVRSIAIGNFNTIEEAEIALFSRNAEVL